MDRKEVIIRLPRILVTYGFRNLTLLLAVSILTFVLVMASPVDPVGQYILGLGTAVSPEQRIEIEEYWYYHSGHQRDHQKLSCPFAFKKRQNQCGQVEQKNEDNSEQGENTFGLLIHGDSFS